MVEARESKVVAHFGEGTDYPLVKTKFDVYNCTYVSLAHWKRDMHLVKELNIDGLRYDPGWGWGERGVFNAPYEFGGSQINGTAERPEYDFSVMDQAAEELVKNDLKTMYVCAYTPPILQDGRASWQGKPTDLDAYAQICEDFAKHWRSSRRAHYYEIWNEPDLTDVFFHDEMEDYFDIYKHAAPAVLRGDPDALVGGPSLAYKDEWMPAFLAYVDAHNLPLHYISYHNYGDTTQKVEDMRGYLAAHPSFRTVQTLMTEYNSFRNGIADFSMGGPIETFEAARHILKDFKWFLEQPDVNKVYWAQFSDPEVYFEKYVDRCGIITTDGHRKAAFNAFKIYGDMPVERKKLTSEDADIEGLASSDKHRCTVVLWNNAAHDKTVTVDLRSATFPSGHFNCYRIDRNHGSFLDNSESETLEAVESREISDTAGFAWTGVIPAEAVVYLTLDDGSLLTNEAVNRAAIEIQTLYDYPDRSKRNYAEFDRKTWTAYLGMAGHDEAVSVVGVIAERLPPFLKVAFDGEGLAASPNENSMLGLQIDYWADGDYSKSVLFHGASCDSAKAETLSWGTKRLPDEAVSIGDLSGFEIDLSRYAPSGWKQGRCILTFIMRNTGAGSRVKATLNQSTGTVRKRLGHYRFNEPGAERVSLPIALKDDFTIAFWFKTTDSGRAGSWYAGSAIASSQIDPSAHGFGISLTGNHLSFGVGLQTLFSSTAINDGKWRHCAVTRCSADGLLQLFMDGKLESVERSVAGCLEGVSGLEVLPSFQGINRRQGAIQELQLFNYALTGGELDEISGNRYKAAEFWLAETDGPFLIDSSRYGKNGMLHGNCVRGIDRPGHTLTFDGKDSYAVIKRNIADDFTIMFWLKTSDSGANGEWFRGKGIIDGKCEGEVFDFGVSLVGNRLAFGVGDNGTTIVSESSVNDNRWHLCAVTRKRSSGELRIFIDGVKEAEGIGHNKSVFSSYELSIGRIHTGINYLAGTIGCIRIFGEALSAEQLLRIAERDTRMAR